MRLLAFSCIALFAASTATALGAEKATVAELCATVKKVGPMGANHRAATAAMTELSALAPSQLPELLAGMDGAGPLATNWLRGAFEASAERALKAGEKLPQAEIERFLLDTNHSPHARRLAYEWILRVEPVASHRLESGFLNDPSLELRRDAVEHELTIGRVAVKESAPAEAKAQFRKALTAARDLDQVQTSAKSLRELGETVDLAKHFGFIQRWQLIGPFDNRDKRGFTVAYPPEKDVHLAATLPGKEGPVSWKEHTTTDELGAVDLNKAIAKHMGAVAYAFAEFESPAERPIELRLGCINANKVWLNGELLTANEVYHANTSLDQYVGRGRLKAGKNQILVKVCQNEQTEDWAQDWKFQLRVCDDLGTAVPSQAANK